MDANSSIPLYRQLKNRLLKRINAGELKPYDRLPSERDLGDEFAISRMTVRQALQALIHEGFLYTRVGKGTFVNNINFEQQPVLTGFTEQMQKLDLDISSQVLGFTLEPASASLAEILETAPNSAVFKLRRLRLANGLPLALEIAYIPQELCPNLTRFDFSKESLYEVMRREYGLRLVSAEQTVVAALADRDEHRLFGTQPPAAVLRMKRVTHTLLNNVAEYVESVYRGETYKLRVLLQAANEK